MIRHAQFRAQRPPGGGNGELVLHDIKSYAPVRRGG
jgi:hypothetical protein